MTLAACGGGGGGSDGGANGSAATLPTIAVTSANYVSVANESAAASSDLLDLSTVSTDSGALVGAQKSSAPNWTAFGLSKAADALNRLDPLPAVLVGAVVTRSLPCNSGTILVSVNDGNGNQVLDGGDSATLVFNNCADPTADTVNGSLTLGFNAQPTGTLGGSAYTFDATVVFTSLSVASADFKATADGVLRLVSVRTGLTTGSDVLSTPSFAVSVVAGGSTYKRSLSNFSARVDLLGAQTSTSFSGIVSSSALSNGSVAFATVNPFVQSTSALFPASGSATATGTSGKTTLTALDATQVRIDLDANSDGGVDATQTKPWNSII
jgi:hypothetical protein